MPAKPISLTEDQVLFFRARRSHLAGPGARGVAQAVRDVVGAQAQQLPPALHAISLRTRGRPTAAEVEAAILADGRRLVRTWGQRDTLHVYDPETWIRVVAARGEWAPGGRGGPMPPEKALDTAVAKLARAKKPLTRRDFLGIAPKSYVKAVAERAALAGMDAERLAAARLFWKLALRGDAVVAGKLGAEQTYAARASWFADLAWPKRPEPAKVAATELARRYLAAHGPATAADVGHFFGARVANARKWLDAIEDELVAIECNGRKGLVALEADAKELRKKPSAKASEWPVRLLPLWDTLMMGHADKSWTVPDEAEKKLVWRKAAYVTPVVLARGRVVATWSQTKRAREVKVEVQPLGAWRASHLSGVRREARELAKHLGVENVSVTVA